MFIKIYDSMLTVDKLIIDFDIALNVIFGTVIANRLNPAQKIVEAQLNTKEKAYSSALMRVNHSGEVCAQALYHAQSRFAHSNHVKKLFSDAMLEEKDHLAWTAERLRELNSRTSFLNPLWYVMAYTLGIIVARMGDEKNLRFIAETERQVGLHLLSHLMRLPYQDLKSQVIIKQMYQDELKHNHQALNLTEAVKTPVLVSGMMSIVSKIMTTLSFYI